MSQFPRVYLLRHGYSTWQAEYDLTRADAGIIDAPLAERGRAQARAVAGDIAALDIDLVITSPLTRAIETTLGVFDGASSASRPPITVDSLLRERLGDSCDIGRSPAVLAADFPDLEFSHLPEVWWHEGPTDARGVPMEPWPLVERRAREFAASLECRAERSILVVSHHGFLRNFCGVAVANCELCEWSGELPAPQG